MNVRKLTLFKNINPRQTMGKKTLIIITRIRKIKMEEINALQLPSWRWFDQNFGVNIDILYLEQLVLRKI